MHVKEVFSPRQIYVGALLGGPLAGIYFIKKNFDSMANPKGSSLSLLLGACCVIAISVLVFVLPEDFPNMLLPILYSGLAAGIAWHFQVSKEEEEVNEQYNFISNWSVAKVSLVSIITYLALMVGFILLLGVLGIEVQA